VYGCCVYCVSVAGSVVVTEIRGPRVWGVWRRLVWSVGCGQSPIFGLWITDPIPFPWRHENGVQGILGRFLGVVDKMWIKLGYIRRVFEGGQVGCFCPGREIQVVRRA